MTDAAHAADKQTHAISFDQFPLHEQEFFAGSCKHWGYRPREFQVTREGDDVMVVHLPTDRARVYQPCVPRSWNHKFDDDLELGYFKRR